jgi:hypothetical protein
LVPDESALALELELIDAELAHDAGV